MRTNKEDILVVHDRWLKAEIAQDMETLGSLLHDEVFLQLPGGTRIKGKEKCLEFLGDDSTQIDRIEISNMWVHADVELAVKMADFETWFVDHRIPVASGTHTWCLIKEAEEWKILMMTWTIRGEH